MDALSQMLRILRPERASFFQAELNAPWRFTAPPAVKPPAPSQPGPQQLLLYYHLVEGNCTLEMEGLAPLVLTSGDVALVPKGDAHSIGSGPQAISCEPVDLQALLLRQPRQLRTGGSGPASRLICGYLACDPALCGQVLSMLPRLASVRVAQDGQIGALQAFIVSALAQESSPQPGAEWVLAKASEMLLAETLRRHLASPTRAQDDRLAGLRDHIVGRCLTVMYDRPADKWTLDRLAKEVNTSRSVLALRFTRLVGQSPMSYLTRWRMTLAADLLHDSSLGLTRIAEEVGYETDTALIRAFRREFGTPPAAWRRARLAGANTGQ